MPTPRSSRSFNGIKIIFHIISNLLIKIDALFTVK